MADSRNVIWLKPAEMGVGCATAARPAAEGRGVIVDRDGLVSRLSGAPKTEDGPQ